LATKITRHDQENTTARETLSVASDHMFGQEDAYFDATIDGGPTGYGVTERSPIIEPLDRSPLNK